MISESDLFFAEANWRKLQNESDGESCKAALGATPPNPCKIGHFITLKDNVINCPILAFFSKSGLQYSPFYFCNKQSDRWTNEKSFKYVCLHRIAQKPCTFKVADGIILDDLLYRSFPIYLMRKVKMATRSVCFPGASRDEIFIGAEQTTG